MPNSESLNDMPLQRRDEMISQVWCFLIERGYTITAPARPKHESGDCADAK